MSPKGLAYVGRRLALAIPTLLTIVLLNFALLQLAPGDAADVLAGEAGSATPEYMAQLRQKFGLDQPLYVQYFRYMADLMRGEFNYSIANYPRTVGEMMAEALPWIAATLGGKARLVAPSASAPAPASKA